MRLLPTSRLSARRRAVASAAVLASITLACSGSEPGPSDPGDPPGTGDPSVATATPAGGVLEFHGGAVVIEIPPGGVSDEVQITATPVVSGLPPAAAPGAVYDFRPDGLTFAQPVVLTVRYDPGRLPGGADTAALRLHAFGPDGSVLLRGSLHDAADAAVSAEIDGFSEYGAAEATPDAVTDAILDLFGSLEDGRLEVVDRLLESLAQDIALVAPRLEAQCIETNVLSEKVALTNTLLDFESMKGELLLDLPITEITSMCGGLMDDTQTFIEIVPDSGRIRPGASVRFDGTIFGPGDQELVGRVRWAAGPAEHLTIDTLSKLATGVSPGVAEVVAVAAELPSILTSLPIWVVDDLEVRIEPDSVVVAYDGGAEVSATTFEVASGEPFGQGDIDWQSADEGVADITLLPSPEGQRAALVDGRSVGRTSLTACVRPPDLIELEAFCSSVTVEVVPLVSGSWAFTESLVVDVDAPATETCEVEGTAQIAQVGRTYSGTTSETITCTYDPGDGSEPDVVVETVQGMLANGRLDETSFYHEVVYSDEACRSSGTLVRGSDFDSNRFVTGSGSTECLDDDDFYSVGPLTIGRPGHQTAASR